MTNSNDMPLAAKPLNRAAHRRLDKEWLVETLTRSDVLIMAMQDGMPLATIGEGGLFWMGPETATLKGASSPLFLGEDKQGTPVFALNLPSDFSPSDSPITTGGEFQDMRAAATTMGDMDANCASTARSLFLWHESHGFCTRCGAATDIGEAGWKRICLACQSEHFPRTDPVAIMLAVRGGKCLLGRQSNWPEGFLSCLAGFCEPGETIEQAAAREVLEEAGIVTDPASAEFVACQPWPFPSSLMVGLILEANTTEITVDTTELESACWISRDEARQMLEGSHSGLFCPPKMAIAHHILKVWAMREH